MRRSELEVKVGLLSNRARANEELITLLLKELGLTIESGTRLVKKEEGGKSRRSGIPSV